MHLWWKVSKNYMVWICFQYPSYQNGINGVRTALKTTQFRQILKYCDYLHPCQNWMIVIFSMKETYCTITLCHKILGSIESNRSNHGNGNGHFFIISLWKFDKNAKYCHSVSLICYKTDFNIYTEERHVKHNKNIGCYGSWLPWQQFHIILFLHKLLI